MSFTIPLKTSVSAMYDKMKSAVLKADGTFEGNEQEGTFMIPIRIGKIAGNYTMNENGIDVSITKKPFFLSTKKIKKELSKYLD